jgi:hypothetical protein
MLIPNTRMPWRPPLPTLNWSGEISNGWLPVDIAGNDPIVRWMNVGSATLSDPFFQSSVARLRGASNELETELEVLGGRTAHLSPAAPAGIIFNMSRCGSTLLVNALRRAEGVVGLSEAGPVEHLMGRAASRSTYWARTAGAFLTPLTTVFAHYQGPPAKNVVIKTATGAIAALRAVRSAWPRVPCIVLVRDPIEVLVSNLRQPPPWLSVAYNNSRVENLFDGLFGSPPANILTLTSGTTDLCAWAIGRYCAEALPALDDACRVVDYEDLNAEAVVGIAKFFGLRFSPEGLADLDEIFRVDAKRPRQAFESDRERKHAEATESVRKAADQWVGASYGELRQRSYQGWRKGL